MERKVHYILFLSALLTYSIYGDKEVALRQKSSPHLLTLYLSPTVATPIVDYENRIFTDITETEKLIKAFLHTNLKQTPQGGVFTTYLGFVDVLSIDHFAIFPLKHAGDTITLIVVKRMYPITIEGQTVERFIRKKNEPVAYYQMRRFKDDQSNDMYWETKKVEAPRDLTIPPHAVVICAHPNEIFIPEGISTAIPGPHLYLPEIFPTHHFRRGMYADVMTFVKISPYFELVRRARRMEKERFAEMIDHL